MSENPKIKFIYKIALVYIVFDLWSRINNGSDDRATPILNLNHNFNVNRPALYCAYPTLSLKDFFYKMESGNKETVRGILLYTDADEILTKYIQEHFQEFHKLSGDWCQIFILEKPNGIWSAKDLSLIKKIKLKFTSIDKTEVYDIARELKIDINQIPCLVFFGAEVKQRLIIPINKEEYLNNFSKYFRELFATVEKIINQAGISSSISAFETISYNFDAITGYLDNNAQQIGYQNNYSYQNQTIITQNFQNEGDIVMSEIYKQINNDLKGAQVAGGLVNADTVNAEQIGGNINNNDFQKHNQKQTENSTVKTILILASNPKNTSQLRLDEEVREIDAGLQRAKKRELFDLKQRWAVRYQEVYQSLLDFKPQIVHFSGHGSGNDGLFLEDEDGNLKLVDTEAIANLFDLFSDTIECVVLNACYSEIQASAIAKYIPYVIGMNQAIGDKAAIKFATGFYNALGAGESVEFAYKLGCNVIQLDGIAEHLTPVLKKR
ncbi:MAG: CHAT domain-containing protein [Rivularia sp. (in: cyanobacteria)]